MRGRKSGWGVREFQPSESTTGRINRLLLCAPAFLHTQYTHTHGGDSDKEKKYTHKQEWNEDAKRKK